MGISSKKGKKIVLFERNGSSASKPYSCIVSVKLKKLDKKKCYPHYTESVLLQRTVKTDWKLKTFIFCNTHGPVMNIFYINTSHRISASGHSICDPKFRPDRGNYSILLQFLTRNGVP